MQLHTVMLSQHIEYAHQTAVLDLFILDCHPRHTGT